MQLVRRVMNATIDLTGDPSDDEGAAAAASSSSSSSAWPSSNDATSEFLEGFAQEHVDEVEQYVPEQKILLGEQESSLAKAKEELAKMYQQLNKLKQKYDEYQPLVKEFQDEDDAYWRADARKKLKGKIIEFGLDKHITTDEQRIGHAGDLDREVSTLEYGDIPDKKTEIAKLNQDISRSEERLENVPKSFYRKKFREHIEEERAAQEESEIRQRKSRRRGRTYSDTILQYEPVICELNVGDIILYKKYNNYNNELTKSQIIEIEETGELQNRIKLQDGGQVNWFDNEVFIGVERDTGIISQKLKDFTLITGKLLYAKSNQELAAKNASKHFSSSAQEKQWNDYSNKDSASSISSRRHEKAAKKNMKKPIQKKKKKKKAAAPGPNKKAKRLIEMYKNLRF